MYFVNNNVSAAKHELCYAGATNQWGIGFSKTQHGASSKWVIQVWVDAAHAVCPMTRRSRTGFFVTLNGNIIISYKSWVQPGVPSQSSPEAEYRALSDVLNETIWMVMVLCELRRH